MDRKVSRLSIIFSIISKDFKELLRDRIWVFLSLFGLVLYPVLYWSLPDTVDEHLNVGVYQEGMDVFFEEYSNDDAVRIFEFESVEDLQEAVEGKEQGVNIGIAFPDDFLLKTMLGEKTTVQIYVNSSLPVEIRNALTSFVRELSFVLQGDLENLLPVELPEEQMIVLGDDRMGDQLAFKEKLKPLLAVLILIVESMALASLIAVEIQKRTITALLSTPMKLSDLLIAKTLFGTMLAFFQAIIVLFAIGALSQSPVILTLLILLGSILVTGIALIAGASGKDFMGTLLYSMFFIIPLMVPTISALFPGSASLWVKVLPTYGLVEGIIRATDYSYGLGDIMPYILMLLAWIAIILSVGLFVFSSRVKRL